MLERVISIIIGYICGLLQTSYLYGRLQHIDIREYGSGNAGTTNALRTLGKKAGMVTFLGDFLKPMVAALIAWLVFRDHEQVRLLEIYAGVGAVLGHIFPCYLGFKGGKGVATIAGMSTLFCFRNDCWYVVPVMMLVFIGVVVFTRYVSLASIIIISVYFVWIIFLGQRGRIRLDYEELYEIYILIGLYSLVAVYKHKANILRLVRGEENKIFQKKQESADGEVSPPPQGSADGKVSPPPQGSADGEVSPPPQGSADREVSPPPSGSADRKEK